MGDAVGDIDGERFGEMLEVAEKVQALVAGDPWMTEASLRSAASEQHNIDPDDFNAALLILASAGRVYAVNLTERQIPTSPSKDGDVQASAAAQEDG